MTHLRARRYNTRLIALYNYVLTMGDGSKWHTGYVYNDDDEGNNDSSSDNNSFTQRPLSRHHSLSLRGVCSITGSGDNVCASVGEAAELLDDGGGESE